jgi:hypothetical protein
MTLEAIKQVIAELPPGDKTMLASWLNDQDAASWDQQIETDFSHGGAGMALLEHWEAEINEGESISLDQFLAECPGRPNILHPGE